VTTFLRAEDPAEVLTFKNPGFEQASENDASWPAHWGKAKANRAAIDQTTAHSGKASLKCPVGKQPYMVSTQMLTMYEPKTYRLSFFMKVRGNVQGKTWIRPRGWWTRIICEGLWSAGPIIYFPEDKGEPGWSDWRRFDMTIDMPPPGRESPAMFRKVIIELTLHSRSDEGTVWLDDFSLVRLEDDARKAMRALEITKYRAETRLDILQFDGEDFADYPDTKADAAELVASVGALRKTLKDGVKAIHAKIITHETDEPVLVKEIPVEIETPSIDEAEPEIELGRRGGSDEDEFGVDGTIEIAEKKAAEPPPPPPEPKKELAPHWKSIQEETRGLHGALDEAIKQLEPISARVWAATQNYRDAKARKREQEREKRVAADRALVPALIERLSASGPATVAKAADSLGRIGDKRATTHLLPLLRHRNERVRIRTIMALAWLRDHQAAPALMKVIEGNPCVWTRRRATQALGQIGGSSCVPFLIKLLHDSDGFVEENAVYSLGWLRDKRAVEPLLDVMRHSESGWTVAATTHALGLIRDPGSFPDLAKTCRLYNAAHGLALYGGEDAKKALEANMRIPTASKYGLRIPYSHLSGRVPAERSDEPGVRQPRCVEGEKEFGTFSDRFHRVHVIMGMTHPRPYQALYRYMGRNGTSLVRYFWDIIGGTPGNLRKYADECLKYDMQMLVYCYSKAKFHEVCFYLGEHPAFVGTYNEEICPGTSYSPYGRTPGFAGLQFRERLKDFHSYEQRSKLELPDLNRLIYSPGRGFRRAGGGLKAVLWTENMKLYQDVIVEYWKEYAQWIRTYRKNSGSTIGFSCIPIMSSNWIGDYTRISQEVDVGGPEPLYNLGGSPWNAYFCDVTKSGGTHPVLIQVSPETYSDGAYAVWLGMAYAHMQMFIEWKWIYQWKQIQPYERYTWRGDLWGITCREFTKMQKLEPYLAPVGTDLNDVALLHSAQTGASFYASGIGTHGTSSHYTHNQFAFWWMLNQERVQFDTAFAVRLNPERLEKYRVLIMSDMKVMTEEFRKYIRGWVRDGGTLIATAQTSLYDYWSRKQPDFLFADIFGVKYLGTEGAIPKGTKAPHMTMTETCGQVKAGDTFEHYQGRDLFETTAARIIAKWSDGKPAIASNRFGKGYSYFLGGHWLGGRKGQAEAARRKIRPVLGALVRSAFRAAGVRPILETSNCPDIVETVLRTQADKRRVMLHLLNYHAFPEHVPEEGIHISLRPPSLQNLKVFYPIDNQPVPYKAQGGRINFTVRHFGLHELVVIQYGQPK